MAVILFLLGRPGSGKSTAARYIHEYAKQRGWDTIHINDYKFLRAMFEADTQHQHFSSNAFGGFDVIDFSVLDLALNSVEIEARQYIPLPKMLLLLEFARDDYPMALQQFQANFLYHARFLFFEADINTCIRRVYERSCNPNFIDDHFISEEMIRSYYREEQQSIRTYNPLAGFDLGDFRVQFIENTNTKQRFYRQVQDAIDTIFVCQDQVSGGTRVTQRRNRVYCALAEAKGTHSPHLASHITQPDSTKV